MLTMKISNPYVAIAGKVLEVETELVVSGTMVEIKEMPSAFRAKLTAKALHYGSQWSKLHARPDRQITASDDYFRFVNLPPGKYVLEVSSNKLESAVSQTVRVAESVDNKIPTTMITLILTFPVDKPN